MASMPAAEVSLDLGFSSVSVSSSHRMTFILQDFFTGNAEDGMMLDEECFVAHCGQLASERGLRLGDQILRVNGVALKGGAQLHNYMCSLYDSQASLETSAL